MKDKDWTDFGADEALKRLEKGIVLFQAIADAEKELNELGFNHKIVIYEPDAKI